MTVVTPDPATQIGTGRRPFDLGHAVKDSILAALVALGLSIAIVGLRTVDKAGGLGIDQRWSWVAIAVGGVFGGRFMLLFYGSLVANHWKLIFAGVAAAIAHAAFTLYPTLGTGILAGAATVWLLRSICVNLTIPHLFFTPRQTTLCDFVVRYLSRLKTPLAILMVVVAIVLPFAHVFFPFLPEITRYHVDVATLVVTYIMLGWGLNIVVGLAGLLDLGYVAFYAVGAYSFALIATHYDWSFWVCLPLAGAFAAFFGVILGFPVLRLRGDYLAIVTLGFGEIIRIILLNWYSVTNGPDGVSQIPRPSFFGLEFDRNPAEGTHSFHTFFGLEHDSMHRIIFLYYLILALALITNLFTLRIRKLPIGRAWEALREDEIACRSLGINPTNTKLTAFAIGAMFAGFAGSFFATRQGFISPESFTFIESAVILAIVVLGGMGSQIGVVVASLLLIGGTEVFRELEEFRMLAFGAAMVAIMVWRPRGLLAHREPTLRLGPAPEKQP